MPTLETLTKSDLRDIFKSKSLFRAHGYIHRVQNPVRSGQTLTAQVSGSRLYQVEIEAGPDGVNAVCDCSYNRGGYCKHIGAVLLKWIQSPDDFTAPDAPPRTTGEYPIEVIPVEPPPAVKPDQPLSGCHPPLPAASTPTKKICSNGSTSLGSKTCAT